MHLGTLPPWAVGAIGGFLGALVADLHVYSAAPDGALFNWRKAAARWVSGAIVGAGFGGGAGVVA